MSRRDELAANLAAVERRVAAACAAAGRSRGEVSVVAISKTWPASDVVLLRDLGVHEFGENRDAEAAQKAVEVPDVRWHFVGGVQTNKARSVASYADVVHSLDRPALVDALSDDTVVRCATGLLIPPSISNPETGNGAPSALTCSLTAFPEVTLKNWLETSTLTVQLCFPH